MIDSSGNSTLFQIDIIRVWIRVMKTNLMQYLPQFISSINPKRFGHILAHHQVYFIYTTIGTYCAF